MSINPRFLLVGVVPLFAWVACGDDSGSGGSGGNGGSTTSQTSSATSTKAQATVTVGSTTGTAMSNCDGAPDDTCDLETEDCDCSDCTSTAFCNPGQCVDDGVCDGLNDSCTCDDCALDVFCSNAAGCSDDGVCDEFVEGCACADCYSNAKCADDYAGCDMQMPNVECSATETCDGCYDCALTPTCQPCPPSDGQCTLADPCYCADCAEDGYCTDASNCFNDGECNTIWEGCVCDDCKDYVECGGTGTGGGGGAGGGTGGAGGGSGGSGGAGGA